MNKLTYGEAKAYLAESLGMNVTDRRVLSYANQACRRLVDKGKWVGTTLRYQVCMNEGLITWPRQIDTIELFAQNTRPGQARNEWFEMLGQGPGLMNADNSCYGSMLVDRGRASTFADVTRGPGILHKLFVVSRVTESASTILVRGYDSGNNWVRTKVGDDWIDGEQIAINETGTVSVNYFAAVTDVIKPVTNGNVDIYEYDPALATNVKKLGSYENDETLPVYRRSVIPGFNNRHSTCPSCTDGVSDAVVVYCKLRFMPVAVDNDFFLIGNLAALTHGVMAIKKEKQELWKEAVPLWGLAIAELESELKSYEGTGVVNQIRFQDSATYGGGGVRNMV